MEFQKGMDLSFIPELEDAGVQVKDFDGTVMDPLDLVQKYGVNSVRLRIWNAPEHVREFLLTNSNALLGFFLQSNLFHFFLISSLGISDITFCPEHLIFRQFLHNLC